MSTHSDESDVTAKHEDTAREPEEEQEEDMPGSNGSIAESFSRTRPADDDSVLDSPVPELNGTSFQGYTNVTPAEDEGDANARFVHSELLYGFSWRHEFNCIRQRFYVPASE